MNDPVYDLPTSIDDAASGGQPNAEPMYEPPGYLPSSYQAVDEPVNLVPKFDAPAPSAPSADASARVATRTEPSVTEYLQNLPAPTQPPVQQQPTARRAAEPAMAGAPASAATLSSMPAPTAGSSAPGASSVPGSLASAPPPAVPAAASTTTSSAPSSAPFASATAPSAQRTAASPVASPAPVSTGTRASSTPTPAAAPSPAAPTQSSQPTSPPAARSQEPPRPQQPAPVVQPAAAPPAAAGPSQPAASSAPVSAPATGRPSEANVHTLPGPVPVVPAAAPPVSPAAQAPASVPAPKPTQPVASAAPAGFTSRRDPSLKADPDLDAALQAVLMTSGSDLHISAGAPPMIRVDGALKPMADAPAWSQDKVTAALLSIITPKQREIFDEHLEFDFAYTLSENARFRVNLYQQRHNMGAAFRLIPTEIKPLSALGVPESISSFAKLARGLVLVTGPTGSGKSTTLAAIIDLVNRTRTDHIMTVEDPIEFLHQNQKSLVNQREVGHDTHSFGAALKHVLRQDPDVILVGELRDLETISVALTAAETGHLVFATLHTQDAPQTIDRIIDVYPPHQQNQVRAQLAATLQGVVCQTLLKRANGKGRVVATEVLMANHAVANLIREGKTYQVHSAMQAGRESGMHTMDQHLADLVNSGDISFEAAVEKAHDYEVLKRLVTRADTSGAVGSNMSDGVNFSDAYSVQR